MAKSLYTKAQMKREIENKLKRHFGNELGDASKDEIFKTCALVLRDVLADRLAETQNRFEEGGEREVHYLSMEFLVGRSLMNNAYNLGVLDVMRAALDELGVDMADIMEAEPDPGLGNGGLGRLAACYMDAMASLGVLASGYSIRYQHGLFKQRIVDGQQVELPDSWLDNGESWLIPHVDEAREVRFGGRVSESWEDGRMIVKYSDYDAVLAVPYDMPISGYQTQNVANLRLWDAKSTRPLDMNLFSQGEYMRAMEEHAMAEVISMVLYPADNHIEGKSLRFKQQYFFVSATIQDIVDKHRKKFGTLKNFAEKHVIHINDTHPALAIPELMRILLDEEHMSWDEAWNIVTRTVAYTNHTVMAEALEHWPQSLVALLVPRIASIIHEINERFCKLLWNYFPGDFQRISHMAIEADGEIKMANLSVAASFSVNGVSALHSDILKKTVFHDFYLVMPQKFTNVTNGIAHRRWLCQANPGLTALITELIGKGFVTDAGELKKLERFASDEDVLARLAAVKQSNKERLADYIAQHNGVKVDTASIFDVQVKRLHEYKRQLLNVMNILGMYAKLKDDPALDIPPRTFIFGAKAFPGYYAAKQIIRLIYSISQVINNDPDVRDKLKVVFLENYRVTLAELIMPAADLSEQISVAGKEASGTGNMKFMINGAVTIGTLDGANVEISEAVGEDNIFLFGLKADEVEALKASGTYSPQRIYSDNADVNRVINMIRDGFGGSKAFPDIASSLVAGFGGIPDPYMLLADFESYVQAQQYAGEVYRDRARFNRMALMNIANAGRFAADRSITEYCDNIWHVDHR